MRRTPVVSHWLRVVIHVPVIIAVEHEGRHKSKLERALARPITSEEQVVYILVELRKLMELNGDSLTFPSLQFHCDWVAHPVMDRAPAKKIVSLFDKHQEVIDNTVKALVGSLQPTRHTLRNSVP